MRERPLLWTAIVCGLVAVSAGCAFAQPAAYTFGNGGRGNMRAPGITNVDLSILRNFRIRERITLQFRGEALNAINRTNLSSPGAAFGFVARSSVAAFRAGRRRTGFFLGALVLVQIALGALTVLSRKNVAVTNHQGSLSDPSVSLFLDDGTGNLAPAREFSTRGFYALVIDDFNGDARQDMAIDCANCLGVMLGNGVSRFGAPTSFSTGPDYFTREDIGVPGTAARRLFHGPGLNNWDFALRKITRVNERISAELRAEFFNLFNHAQFNNSNGNVASSNFGRVTGAKPGRIGQLGLRIVF